MVAVVGTAAVVAVGTAAPSSLSLSWNTASLRLSFDGSDSDICRVFSAVVLPKNNDDSMEVL